MSSPLRVVGLMSGTSADGVDAALVRITGSDTSTEIDIERFITIPYPADVREQVQALACDRGNPRILAALHFRLAEIYADAATEVQGTDCADLIACHGQTVIHLPQPPLPVTLQLGAPAVIAVRTGLTVVSDFRPADMAAGGQGAPLVCLLDGLLFRDQTVPRIALNIGGIANVTYVPPRDSNAPLLAFDTGPGNCLIDRAIFRLTGGESQYDEDGRVAATGVVVLDDLDELMKHPYFSRTPPKSTGKGEFGDESVDEWIDRSLARQRSVADIVATLSMFTATSIAAGLQSLPPVQEVIVSGGGAHNSTLLRFLRRRLGPMRITESDAYGIPIDAKEAVAFAVLGNQTVRGLQGNVPTCTGADRPRVLGSITPGDNYSALMRTIWS